MAAAVLAGFIVVALCTGWYVKNWNDHRQNTPENPILRVLGQEVRAEWKDMPAQDVFKPQWREMRDLDIRGSEKKSPATRETSSVSGPQDLPKRFVPQDLFSLYVPNAAGRQAIRSHVGARCYLPADMHEYVVSVIGCSGSDRGMYARWQTSYDHEHRILTIRVAWVFVKADVAKECVLRYCLTPDGFVYIDPDEQPPTSGPAGGS